MATIKEICQNFCYRINVPAPSGFAGFTSPTEAQYLSLFKYIGDNLRNRPYAWPQLKRGYTFTTSSGVSKYELPGDFYRLLESDQWDTTNKWPLRGPISDFNMAVRQFSVVSLQTRKAFRLIGPIQHLYNTSPYNQRSAGYFEIDPAGQNNTDTLFMGYLSCNWVWPLDWTAHATYSAGALVSGDGNIYYTQLGGIASTTRPNWTSGSDTDGGVTWSVYTEPYPVTTSNAALSDNDLCLFDEDLMIEGMRWAYLRAKNQDYQQERNDWEQQVKSAYARFNGPVRVNMADEFGENYEFPNIAAGSWNV